MVTRETGRINRRIIVTTMIDWDDFDMLESDEEEERIRQERLQQEEEQQRKS